MPAPGLAGAASAVLGLPSGGSVSVPGFTSSSSAAGRSDNRFDNSGFTVNVGGGMPQWVVLAAIAGGVWWLARKR